MREKILVLSRAGARSVPPDLVARLEEHAEVEFVVRQEAPDPAETLDLLARATVLASTNVTLPRLDDAVLARLPRLHSVVLYATGYEHVDLESLARHGVNLSVLPEYATGAVAEHALGLALSLATRTHLANDKSRGMVPRQTSLRGVELGGRTLGIVGVGRIGSHLARLASGIGMRVLGSDIDPGAGHRPGRRASRWPRPRTSSKVPTSSRCAPPPIRDGRPSWTPRCSSGCVPVPSSSTSVAPPWSMHTPWSPRSGPGTCAATPWTTSCSTPSSTRTC